MLGRYSNVSATYLTLEIRQTLVTRAFFASLYDAKMLAFLFSSNLALIILADTLIRVLILRCHIVEER